MHFPLRADQAKRTDNMKFNSRIMMTATLMLALASASLAGPVKTDYDRSANFGQYKTYSWQKVSTRDPLMVDRIKSAVNASLAAKGWTEVPSGGDAAIFAIETTKEQQTLNTFYDGFGGGWGRRGGGFGGFGDATTTTETYKVGTLLVDICDAKSKAVIWRGSESDTLSNNSDKNIKELDKNVNNMFKHFPPEAGRK
jgi:hypothetical protein